MELWPFCGAFDISVADMVCIANTVDMGRSTATKNAAYEEIAGRVIAAMQRDGVAPWRRPWTARGSTLPRNAISGKAYRGVNVLLTLITAAERGYSSPLWLTFKQANDLAARAARAQGREVVQTMRGQWVYADGSDKGRSCGGVRKGQSKGNGQGGTEIVFWKPTAREEQGDNGETTTRRGLILRTYHVFNIDQCDDAVRAWATIKDQPAASFDPVEAAERICEGFDVETMHGGDRACYSPERDVIRLPKRESFGSPEEYYSTRFHEMGHATGHVSRLNRPNLMALARFASHEYSQEELVAEFCALFLAAEAGIERVTEANSTAYLACWAQKIKDDPAIVVMAAQQAQKAADCVLGRAAADGASTEGEAVA